MFSFIPIASGSSGNCYIVEAHKTRVIVDIGISFSSFVRMIREFDLLPDSFSRIFITHAHSDHTSGLIGLLKKTSIPVYTRQKTKDILLKRHSAESHLLERLHVIATPMCEEGDLTIRYFKVPHGGWLRSGQDDAGDPIGFLFEWQGYRLAFTTDCGHLTDGVKQMIKASDAYIMESNYDHELQLKSPRPWGLKTRIMGEQGHLSNEQTAQYLTELTDSQRTKHIFLAHLSKQCNTPELAEETVRQRLKASHPSPELMISTKLLRRHVVGYMLS
ncbi:MAG: MBL fold metallo-hydrolase [Candidatus Margulisiibacteriota bacterium]